MYKILSSKMLKRNNNKKNKRQKNLSTIGNAMNVIHFAFRPVKILSNNI